MGYLGINRLAAAVLFVAITLVILATVHAVYSGSSGGSGTKAVLTIDYEVVSDEEVLRAAHEVLTRCVGIGVGSSNAPSPGEAVVVRVTIRLRNEGDSPISYNARQYLTPYAGSCVAGAEPITSTMHPAFSMPVVRAEEGTYLRFSATVTDDLSHLPLLPGEEVENAYYLIVSKDFAGTVEARATVCAEPGTGCVGLASSVHVSVSD